MLLLCKSGLMGEEAITVKEILRYSANNRGQSAVFYTQKPVEHNYYNEWHICNISQGPDFEKVMEMIKRMWHS